MLGLKNFVSGLTTSSCLSGSVTFNSLNSQNLHCFKDLNKVRCITLRSVCKAYTDVYGISKSTCTGDNLIAKARGQADKSWYSYNLSQSVFKSHC